MATNDGTVALNLVMALLADQAIGDRELLSRLGTILAQMLELESNLSPTEREALQRAHSMSEGLAERMRQSAEKHARQ